MEADIPVHRIDERFAPRPKPTVATVELDGERVLYDTESWRFHQLDPVASIIWACFDGTTSVEEMASDLADAFSTDVERVQADVLELVRGLATEDLLLGVSPADRKEPDGEPQAVDAALRRDEVPSFLVDPPGG